MMNNPPPRHPSPGAPQAHSQAAQAEAPRDPRRLDSEQLFGAAREIEISHAGAVYRLRRTALGKLILTK
jgi:hemin uptake protein HemP